MEPTPKAPEPLNEAAVAKLIREEIDRNNNYMTFAQNQIEQDRKFFRYLYQTAASILLVIVAAAGVFQYSSVGQMRSDLKASVDDARTLVKSQLDNVRTEVQNRVTTEFQSKNITDIIAFVAKERTSQEISGIIRSEVSKYVDEQNPLIKKTVSDAVEQLRPTMIQTVEDQTQKQVQDAVAPIQDQMSEYSKLIKIETTATLARSDDRLSFDYLVRVSKGQLSESNDENVRKISDITVGAIISDKKYGLRLSIQFRDPHYPEELRQFMKSEDRRQREAALDAYQKPDVTILPILADMIKNDDSVSVLFKAVFMFNQITGASFEFWEEAEILEWWSKTKDSFEK